MHYLVIDPGHGGDDPGAIGPTGLREADVNLTLGLYLLEAVHADGSLEPVLLRAGDVTQNLGVRTSRANYRHTNNDSVAAYISLHCNAYHSPVAEGFEVWTSPGTTYADHLATCIWRMFRHALPGRRPRLDMCDGDPDKESRFWVLVHTLMPAVLVETAFISNPYEEALLRDDRYLRLVAAAMTEAVAEYTDWRLRP